MALRELTADSGFPPFEPGLPGATSNWGRFEARFARTRAELEAAQRLRFEVFNLELGEGLQESFATGRDSDRFDPVCHHLLVLDTSSGTVVGTYRMQTGVMAAAHHGFYSSDEFALEQLPTELLDESVEIGRAAVARDYRNRQVLFLLWKGLATYMQHNRKRYLFGCCSVTSQDATEGLRVMRHLERVGAVHPEFRLDTRRDWECVGAEPSEESVARVSLPKLFRLYLRYGARVCSAPAIDRFFKTIDYLVLLDVDELDPETRGMFFTES